MNKKKPIWYCPTCGASTTNPEDRLIEYAGLHLGCKGKKKK
jgi:hypothetical protein